MTRRLALPVALLAFTSPVEAQTPYAQSEIVSGPQFREMEARVEQLEMDAGRLEKELKGAETDEEKALLQQQLDAVEAEWTAITRAPKHLWPALDKMAERIEEIGGMVPDRFDPEPVSVEDVEFLGALFYEDFGALVNARWQDSVIGWHQKASTHPDLSPKAALAIRNNLVGYYYDMSRYYSADDIMVSVRVMGQLAEGLFRSSESDDEEAREIADHLTKRVYTWTQELQMTDEHRMYSNILGDLQETDQLLEESAPDWLDNTPTTPEEKKAVQKIQDAVSKIKRAARRDNRDPRLIEEVLAFGGTDWGNPRWNEDMTKMELILICKVLTKSRKTVSPHTVERLAQTLLRYPDAGRLSDRSLIALWVKAVDALFRRAETTQEVTLNVSFLKKDCDKRLADDVLKLLLRSYATFLRKPRRAVAKETVEFVDRHLCQLAAGEKIRSKEHWILWGRAASSLGKGDASSEMKSLLRTQIQTAKDPAVKRVFTRVWRSIGDGPIERSRPERAESQPSP